MLKSKSAIGPVVASALLLVVAVVAVVGFQTWFGNYSSGVFTKTELQSNSDETIQIEKIIGNTVYLKNSKNTTISLSKLKVGSIDCNVNQTLSYGVTGIDISSCLAQITSKSQNIVAYTNKAVVSKDVYISDWDSTTPYLSLSSNWTTIPYNTSVNLSWSGNNLNTCTASGAWSGSKSTSNSEVISNLITNSTFTLDCTSSSVNVSKSVDVVVTDLPIITFSAENSSIPFNSSTNLVWSVANADTCTASGNWSGSKTTSGTYNTTNLDVSGNHSYTLTCNGFGGQSAITVIVTVANDFINATGGTITFNTTHMIHTFTSSGVFSITKGSGEIFVVAVGGGGGGGGAYTCNALAGGYGGGGGGANASYFTVSNGQTYNVVVGNGGAGGANLADGSAGGISSVGSLISVGGGGGGSRTQTQFGGCGGSYYGAVGAAGVPGGGAGNGGAGTTGGGGGGTYNIGGGAGGTYGGVGGPNPSVGGEGIYHGAGGSIPGGGGAGGVVWTSAAGYASGGAGARGVVIISYLK